MNINIQQNASYFRLDERALEKGAPTPESLGIKVDMENSYEGGPACDAYSEYCIVNEQAAAEYCCALLEFHSKTTKEIKNA